ncbi:TatD DNase family protein [Novimethylophilus kurashikiensis]|uniref:TatD DNase family protein n=1 Tax=Novimethylophilus kurashikiensis TaxID=1825523 RepID=A0A2R5FG33_9PROT|nr:TatD family hydrolase [Novimethylophilus kurashikiensis]GBG15251.1 TatD DNase family protein [Novimethylophilus kurashikiensis]
MSDPTSAFEHGLVDTHCHLDAAEFDADRAQLVARAREAGVSEIVVPGINRQNFEQVAHICEQYDLCRPAFGIHPLFVDQADDEDLDLVRERCKTEGVVAVGEIGLDFYCEGYDAERQVFFLSEQLKIARDLGLPVILHVRKAVDHVLKHLRRIEVPGGIAHAFNGSRQQAEILVAMGFKLGFGGAMTWERARHIRGLAATLPLESIVLETDAPDIPPEWVGKGRNEPGELRKIAEVLAQIRGIAVVEIIAATTQNARAALPCIAPVKK